MRACVFCLILILGIPIYASAQELSGLLRKQSSYSFEENELAQQEWLLDVEYGRSLFRGDLTAIGRVRWDTEKDLNRTDDEIPDTYSEPGKPLFMGPDGLVELRELYWETSVQNIYWRVGKQQVVWGEADGVKLLDVINPQSFREFILDDFDDSRIPLWMVNMEVGIGEGVLQVLLIPDASTHELAPFGSPFEFTSTRVVPEIPQNVPVVLQQAEAPDSGDFGTRLTYFVGGWDISMNYLYHYVDTPVIRVAGQTVLQEYERSHLVGGSASTAFGDWTFRSEFTYETDRFFRQRLSFQPFESDVVNILAGFDWQGWTDQFISFQMLNASIVDDDANLLDDKNETTATFLWESNFLNETLTLEWLQIHSINHGDGVIQPQMRYNLEANIDVYLGFDVFYGGQNGLYGQFDDADRFSLGLVWGF